MLLFTHSYVFLCGSAQTLVNFHISFHLGASRKVWLSGCLSMGHWQVVGAVCLVRVKVFTRTTFVAFARLCLVRNSQVSTCRSVFQSCHKVPRIIVSKRGELYFALLQKPGLWSAILQSKSVRQDKDGDTWTSGVRLRASGAQWSVGITSLVLDLPATAAAFISLGASPMLSVYSEPFAGTKYPLLDGDRRATRKPSRWFLPFSALPLVLFCGSHISCTSALLGFESGTFCFRFSSLCTLRLQLSQFWIFQYFSGSSC